MASLVFVLLLTQMMSPNPFEAIDWRKIDAQQQASRAARESELAEQQRQADLLEAIRTLQPLLERRAKAIESHGATTPEQTKELKDALKRIRRIGVD